MTFVGNIRIRGEHDIGFEDSHAGGDCFTQVAFGIESAVLKVQEVHIINTEHLGAFDRFLPADFYQVFRQSAFWSVHQPVSSVEADEETDLLAQRYQLGYRGPAPDFYVIGVGSNEEVAGETLQLGKRGCRFENKSQDAHFTLALLASSS